LLSKTPTRAQGFFTACRAASGLVVVLNNLSEQIRKCLRHAEDCSRKADAQTDPNLKEDFLNLERRWLFLARSYEFTDRLTLLSDETKRHADKLAKRGL
jgi:hypothetical protein